MEKTQSDILGLAKPVTPRDPDYLDFIRRQPCLVCRKIAEPHHFGPHGLGIKGSDYKTVPLCRYHHSLLTAVGWSLERFEQKFCLDFKEEAIILLSKYIQAIKEENKP